MRKSLLQAAILAGAAWLGPSATMGQQFDAYAPQDPYLQGSEVNAPLVPPAPHDFPNTTPYDDGSYDDGSGAPLTLDDFPQNPGMIPDYATQTIPQQSFGYPMGDGHVVSAATSPQTIAPNMIGDFFGVSGGASLLSLQTDAFRLTGAYRQSGSGDLIYFPASLAPGNFVNLTSTSNLEIRGIVNAPIPAGTVWTSQDPHFVYTPTFGLAENPVETAAVNTAYPASSSATFVSGTATRDPNNATDFSIDTTYIVHRPSDVMTLVIPDPGAAPGAFVGRQKIANNSSPIPRTRVFVNYSFFNNTPLTQQGVNVNRVTPGFEYAFYDDNLSIEVRAPFASTFDSDINFIGRTNTSQVAFGNITAYLKALMFESDTFSWSGGIGMSVPTAKDVNIGGAGVTGLRIKNEAYHLLPFLGFLWTPSERLFAQGFLQFDIDANGNPVYLSSFNNGVPTGNLSKIGNANDSTYAFVDLGLGYWMYRNRHCDGFINGFAPTIELHYNAATQGADTITSNNFAGMGVRAQVGTPGDLEVTNLVLGMTAIIGDSGTLTMGYATPVAGDDQYDGQFRAFFNWYFGPQTY